MHEDRRENVFLRIFTDPQICRYNISRRRNESRHSAIVGTALLSIRIRGKTVLSIYDSADSVTLTYKYVVFARLERIFWSLDTVLAHPTILLDPSPLYSPINRLCNRALDMSLRIFHFFYRSKVLISDTSRKKIFSFFFEIFKNFTTNVTKNVTFLLPTRFPEFHPDEFQTIIKFNFKKQTDRGEKDKDRVDINSLIFTRR